jgi:2-keto-3-deoxy-L-rhamnonate aldolase RhmA
VTSAGEVHKRFKKRLCDREPVVGIFVKTATHQVFELVGQCDLDYIVIDTEHAPFDRNTLDLCLMTARALALPAIVRVDELGESAILSPLDMGAAGVMVPHVRTREEAETAVRYAKYAGAGRGFSASPRAGGYGKRSMEVHLREADLETTVVAMIEDPTATANIEQIAAVEGIDGVFVGRHDLAVALGQTNSDAPAVEAEMRKVYNAIPNLGAAGGVLVSAGQVPEFRAFGFSMFLIGTDQGLLRGAVSNAAETARAALE